MEPDLIPAVLKPQALASHFLIRAATPDDLNGLREGCWAHYTKTRSREMLRRVRHAQGQNRGMGILIEDKKAGTLVAYGQVLRWGNCAEISDLMVVQAYRSQGIGSAMIHYLVKYALQMNVKAVEIGAALSNPRALALYKRLGFKVSYEIELNLTSGRESVTYLVIPMSVLQQRYVAGSA